MAATEQPESAFYLVDEVYPLKKGRGVVLLAYVCVDTIQIAAGSRIDTSDVGPVAVRIQGLNAEAAQDVWEQLKLEENDILAVDLTALNEVRAMIYEFLMSSVFLQCPLAVRIRPHSE